jgi:DNA-binding MarR family transcriptional regulator
MSNPSSPQRPSPDLAALGQRLFEAWQAVEARLLDAVRAAGHPDVRAAHLPVLLLLADGARRVTDLATGAHVAKASIVYLVDDLADRGYVERIPDPRDRRSVLVAPTGHGRAALDALLRAVRQVAAEWARRTGAHDAGPLLSALSELAQAAAPPPDRREGTSPTTRA